MLIKMYTGHQDCRSRGWCQPLFRLCQQYCANWFAGPGMKEVIQEVGQSDNSNFCQSQLRENSASKIIKANTPTLSVGVFAFISKVLKNIVNIILVVFVNVFSYSVQPREYALFIDVEEV